MPKIRIPRGFFDDHMDRGLPTPNYGKWRGGYVIDSNDANFVELIDDAVYYSADVDACLPGLKRAATVLLKTVRKELEFCRLHGMA